MKERPILFSAPMVRALLDGRKTQTRRVVKGAPVEPEAEAVMVHGELCFGERGNPGTSLETFNFTHGEEGDEPPIRCPYGVAGDTLWVREAHAIFAAHGQHRADGQRWGPWGGLPTKLSQDRTQIAYFRQGFDRCDPGRWRPSIHMPRWASRISLRITDVRVERLQDISREDAAAEGLVKLPASGRYAIAQGDQYFGSASHDAREVYSWLWERINGAGSWDANPWVWAVSFSPEDASQHLPTVGEAIATASETTASERPNPKVAA